MRRGGDSEGPPAGRLFALFAAAVVALNFPLLTLWDRDATLFGLPLLGVALFAIWAGLIVALAWATLRGSRRRQPLRPAARPSAPGADPRDGGG